MKSELDFLIPTGIHSVTSLVGEFDSTLSNFKGTAVGVDSDPFKEITCKKVNASIAFELSDIQIESHWRWAKLQGSYTRRRYPFKEPAWQNIQ